MKTNKGKIESLSELLNECLETYNQSSSFEVIEIAEDNKLLVKFNIVEIPEDDYVGFCGY